MHLLNPKRLLQKFRRWFDITSFRIAGEQDFLIENISMLIASGVGVSEALQSITQEIASGSGRRVAGHILDDVKKGVPLWRVLGSLGIFSDRVVSLIRIGEESGRLAENLLIVSEQGVKDRELKGKIRSALMYPVFVLGVTVVVGVSIAWFILPRLTQVFGQLNIELPAVTKALIASGTFLEERGAVVLPWALLATILLFYFFFFFRYTKCIGQRFLFIVPPVRRIIIEIELSRFGYLLGTLISAGVPIVTAIQSLADATQSCQYRKFYLHLGMAVSDGFSFRDAFASYRRTRKLIPGPVRQLIMSAERSGTLAETLQVIGQRYEKKTDTSTKNLTTLLEPILLVIVWLGVVAVALAVILPIYQLTGGFNRTQVIEEVPTEVTDAIESTGVATETLFLQVVSADGDPINVRQAPSRESAVVGAVFESDTFEYTALSGEWYQIRDAGGSTLGWVYRDYVSILE